MKDAGYFGQSWEEAGGATGEQISPLWLESVD